MPVPEELPPDHPLRSAMWIWPQGSYEVLHNIYADFRRSFVLDEVPASVSMHITADAQYVLHVNGHYVNRGPARGYQRSWPFDTHDIAEHLQIGENIIAVQVHNPGRGTFQYRHEDAAGLLCTIELPDQRIVTDESWGTRLDATHSRLTPKLSVQLGYQEHVDLTDSPPPDLVGGDASDYDWHPPRMAYVFGHEPWSGMTERGVPHLTTDIIDYEPIDGATLAFDLGRTRLGTLRLDIDAETPTELEISFVQAVDADGEPILPPKTVRNRIDMAAKLRVDAGQTHWEAFQPIGHRYLFIQASGEVRVMPTLRETIYPLDIAGTFETDDAEVDAIWEMCRETQRVCLTDAYTDTPWREQAQWWGDARVQSQNTFHLVNDDRPLVRGIRSIIGQQLPNGLTYGHAPTMAHTCVLPDFSLIWMMTLWDHWWQTGDTDLFLEQWPNVQKVLRYFRTEGLGEAGLLKYDPRYWLFLDWCDLHDTGTPTLLNLWHAWMLDALAEVCDAADREEDAYVLRAERTEQLERIDAVLFDADAGLYIDGLDASGEHVPRHSIHCQTLALLAQLRNDAPLHQRIADYLAGDLHGGANPSSYWVTYVYDVAEKLGMEHAMLDHIARHWAPMLPYGGCFESFATDTYLVQETVSHAWAAHPLYHLMRTLGGIRQTAAGWDQVTFKPVTDWQRVGRCDTVFPTPHGNITVRWQRDDAVHLQLPETITADIRLPDVETTVTGGMHHWRLG
ncbi:MAG: alpha-L-rhamnosidase C-terminal domain-containing protein [Planctomycetota bacterium]